MEGDVVPDNCQDCDMCEVMPDGSLFCVAYDRYVHSNQSCDEWIEEPEIFIGIQRGYDYDED